MSSQGNKKTNHQLYLLAVTYHCLFYFFRFGTFDLNLNGIGVSHVFSISSFNVNQ